jgi:hypothetical protein
MNKMLLHFEFFFFFIVSYINGIPLLPISSVFQETVDLGGVETVKYVATVNLNSDTPEGIVKLGSSEIHIRAIPPIYNLQSNTIATVPVETILRTGTVNVAGDAEHAFLAQQTDALYPTIFDGSININTRRLMSLSPGEFITNYVSRRGPLINSNDRKLMTFCPDCPGWLPIGGTQETRDRIDELRNSVERGFNEDHKWMENMDEWVYYNQKWEANINDFAENVTDFQSGVLKKVDEQEAELDKESRDINGTNAHLAMFGEQIQDRINEIQDIIKSDRDSIEASAIQTKDELVQLYNMFIEFVNHTGRSFEYIVAGQQRSGALTAKLASVMWSIMRKATVRRKIIKQVYVDLQNIPEGFVPMTRGGLVPLNLIAEDERLLIERFTINYVGKQGAIPFLFSVDISFYADREWSVENSSPFMTVDEIIRNVGPSRCQRQFVRRNEDGTIVDEDIEFNNRSVNFPCKIWIELSQTTCQSSGTDIKWSNADPTLAPNRQSGEFLSGMCHADVTPTRTPEIGNVVFRTYKEFKDYFEERVCDVQLYDTTDKIQVIAHSAKRIKYLAQNLNSCYQDIYTQSDARPLDLFFSIQVDLQLSMKLYIVAVMDVLLKEGRLPAGIDYRQNPFGFTPNIKDANGDLLLDGVADIYETYTYYVLLVSTATENVALIEPRVNNFVSKDIKIDSFNFSGTPEYTMHVPESNVELTSDLATIVPGVPFYIVGDLFTEDYVIDPFDNAVEIVSSVYLRENTMGYLAFPPDVTTFPTLDDWILFNRDPNFLPKKATSHTKLFRRKKSSIIGPDGATYYSCSRDVSDGIPVEYSLFLNASASVSNKAASGRWCTVLDNFYVNRRSSGGRRIYGLIPKVWSYRAQVIVYSGSVTTVLGESRCPQVRVLPGTSAGRVVSLTNTGQSFIPIRVEYHAFDSSQGSICDGTFDVSIAPLSVKPVNLPSCGSVNLTVSRLVSFGGNGVIGPNDIYSICVTLNSSTVDQIINAFDGADADIQASITIVNDRTLSQVNDLYQTMMYNTISILGIFTTIIGNGNLTTRLQIASDAIANIGTDPIQWKRNVSTNLDVLSAIEEFRQLVANDTAAWAGGAAIRAQEEQALENIVTNQRGILTRLYDTLAAQLAQNLTVPQTKVPSFGSGGSFGVGGIGDFFAGIWDGLKNIFGGGNILGGLLQLILPLAVIAGVIFIIVKLYQCTKARSAASEASRTIIQLADRTTARYQKVKGQDEP